MRVIQKERKAAISDRTVILSFYQLEQLILDNLTQPTGPARDKLVYLAGPMQHSVDYGKGWRVEATEKLTQAGYTVFNPSLMEECLMKALGFESVREFLALKQTDPDDFIIRFRDIIAFDILAINMSNIVIVRYEKQVASGTIHEVGEAYLAGIPIIMVSNTPQEKLLVWTHACADCVVSNIDEAVEQADIFTGAKVLGG